MSKEKTQEVLNQTVADLSQAAALVHQTHWYMRGSGFLTLHPKMDEFMDALNEHLDEFAERLITIGGSPVSTLKEFDEKSKIELQPATWDKSMSERLHGVLDTYKYLAKLFQEGMDIAESENDAVTVDLYTVALGDVEKTIWMLEAELG
ncbi:Dps family protein [Lactococcus formosensis]|jgi:DNA-binding ferritin-like protein (oxidative damage protectant)|uniref:DNA starvation/stationary phase protection protein n=1 Tax=Lactococcus formosensis TaxID=1281486 RepID=A0A9Q9D6M5_9LACT|nr:Dps family protein [Lactococcus formosensis]NHI67509.1 DNA starvation/stationary phase protection protein [Lactococcus garvieae]MCO7180785.1 DNA starvation/stationary phase protection protein [Lactococcus formosensis]MDG6111828.1 DNA starvation/stationary phase protection protein [Lactococcus formosensis]MDG6118028.1 DNA starvation/stationary phase protection protein [Lactococcus formosensis]MDG6120306.1 DNA starvation/stationary phase protection protein [Lactococcus formosensis]